MQAFILLLNIVRKSTLSVYCFI